MASSEFSHPYNIGCRPIEKILLSKAWFTPISSPSPLGKWATRQGEVLKRNWIHFLTLNLSIFQIILLWNHQSSPKWRGTWHSGNLKVVTTHALIHPTQVPETSSFLELRHIDFLIYFYKLRLHSYMSFLSQILFRIPYNSFEIYARCNQISSSWCAFSLKVTSLPIRISNLQERTS